MLLSIIIPAYNAGEYIRNCLDSVYRTIANENLYEVILVDDGSKDETSSIIKDYKTEHSCLKLLTKDNGGVSSARNLGIKNAQGTYVLFLDADDELVEGALDKVLYYLSKIEPVDMLVTRQVRCMGDVEKLDLTPPLEEHKRYSGVEAYRNQYVRTNAGGGICRTEFLRQRNLTFPEGVRNGEDGVFFAHLQVYAQSIVYYDSVLYRINEVIGSASRVDHTKIGLSLVETLKAVAVIRNNLHVSNEQKGIFDYVVYQMLSNASSWFAESKELSYLKFKELVKLDKLLPLHTRDMCLMKRKAMLMNISFPFFYFLCWINSRFNQ